MSEQAGEVAGAEDNAAARYVMDKPMNFPQLHAELAAALPGVSIEYEAEKTDGTPFGPDNPLTLIVRPPKTPSKKVNQVLNDHVANSSWNVASTQHSQCLDVAKKCVDAGWVALNEDEKECLMGSLAGFLVANPALVLPHKDHDTTS